MGRPLPVVRFLPLVDDVAAHVAPNTCLEDTCLLSPFSSRAFCHRSQEQRSAPRTPNPAGHRGFRLVWRGEHDGFESDARLHPLIGAHRELLRLHELLQFRIGRRSFIR
jgi:hypothetical protein